MASNDPLAPILTGASFAPDPSPPHVSMELVDHLSKAFPSPLPNLQGISGDAALCFIAHRTGREEVIRYLRNLAQGDHS